MTRKEVLLCVLLKSQTTATFSGTASNVLEIFAAFEPFPVKTGVCPHLHIQPYVLLLIV